MIADSDSSAIQVESSQCKENFYTSFLVGLVRGLSDDARLKGPSRGGDHPPGVPRGRLPYLTWGGGLDLPVKGFGRFFQRIGRKYR